MNVQIRTFKKDHCSVHIKRNIRHIRYLRKYQTRNTRTPSTSPNIWETTSYSSSKSILQITTLKQLKIWSSTKENKKKIEELKNELNTIQLHLMKLKQEQNASSWLTSLPLKEEDYIVNKQCFFDLVRIRYGWQLDRLPLKCEYGSTFSIDRALNCKKEVSYH